MAVLMFVLSAVKLANSNPFAVDWKVTPELMYSICLKLKSVT